jgi:hypothetical protein
MKLFDGLRVAHSIHLETSPDKVRREMSGVVKKTGDGSEMAEYVLSKNILFILLLDTVVN